MRNTAGLLEKRYAKSGKTTDMPVLDLIYDYDPKGTISRVTSRENTTAALAFFEETFTYDWLDRLTRSVGPAWRGGTVSYTFDEFGNRLTETSGGTTKTYCYLPNQMDQLDGVRTGSCGGAAVVSYYYDNEGRVKDRFVNVGSLGQAVGTWSFTYTAQGEIKIVDKFNSGSSIDLTYYYDGNGRRVRINDYNGGTAQDTYFAYSGLGPLVEWRREGSTMHSL